MVPSPRFTFLLVVAAVLGDAGETRAQRAVDETAAPDCVREWSPACEALLEDAPVTDDESIVRATAEVDAPLAAMHGEDPTVSGTAVSLRDRAYPGEELADVLPEIPGVRLSSTGAPGQFVGVRLRGGSYQQTTVLLGDLPISSPESVFDLSLVPTWALERVEVYRGDAPVWIGNGSIGGVVRLVPRHARGSEADVHLAGGSFGTYQVAGGLSASTSRVSTVAAVGLAGTRGDFPYFRDPTPLSPGDEAWARRQNGDNTRGSVLIGATVELDAGTLETLVLAVGRQGGSIGGGLSQARDVHAVDRQLWSATSFTRDGSLGARDYRVQARIGVGAQRSAFFDPLGELGGDRDATDDFAITTDARLAGSLELARRAELVSVASAQSFDRRPHDAFDPIQEPRSNRFRYDQSLELRLHGEERVRWELRPSARVTVSRGSLRYEELNALEEQRADVVAPTFRLGAVLAPLEGVALRASLHHGVRLPSLLELFGDRGAMEANPDLHPERSTGGEVGGSTCFERGILELSADAAAAVDRRLDLIVVRKTGYTTTQAMNVEDAWVASFELLGRAELTEHLRADVQATYLVSRTDDGFAIPLQPALGLFARVEGGTGAIGRHLDDLALYVEAMHVGASFTDTRNLDHIPARTPLSTGVRARLFANALSASFEVVDVFDARGFDLANFPLPGRRFAAQLEYRKDL